MSQNYNVFFDQLLGIGKWGQSIYRAGELNVEQKKKLRDEIFSFRELAKTDEYTLTESIERSRKILVSYVLDFGAPARIPDFFMNHLDDVKQLIQSIDSEMQKEHSKYVDYDFDAILAVLSDRFIRTASKILRISFQVRNPPMQIPSSADLYVPRETKDIFS